MLEIQAYIINYIKKIMAISRIYYEAELTKKNNIQKIKFFKSLQKFLIGS